MLLVESFPAVLFLGALLFLLSKGIYIVQQSECLVIERLGKFHKVLPSGLNMVIPFFDQPRKIVWSRHGMMQLTERIDLREVVMDIPEQRVITKDNVGILVDALIYVQIMDPTKAVYEIQSVPLATAQLTQTSLRSLIGELELDHTLSSRELINTRLKQVLDEATEKWGLRVTRVELKNIIPPAEVQQAMEKQMQAERERRAQVLTAEGTKQSGILVAEGERASRIQRSLGEQQEKINQAQGSREAQVLEAEGQARSIEAVAQAHARAIEHIKQAFGSAETTASYLIAMEYLKTFSNMTTKSNDKIIVPYEASGTMGILAGIQQIIGNSTLKGNKA